MIVQIALGIILGLGLHSNDTGNEKPAIENQVQRPVAMVLRYRPDVMIKNGDSEEFKTIVAAQELYPQDMLRTGDNGYALVRFMDMSEVRLRPNSVLLFDGEVAKKGEMKSNSMLEIGEIMMNVVSGKSEHSVETNNVVAAVRGTSFTITEEEGMDSNLVGFSGRVEVTSLASGKVTELTGGSRMLINRQGEVLVDEIADDELLLIEEGYLELEKLAVPDLIQIKMVQPDGTTEWLDIPYYKEEKE